MKYLLNVLTITMLAAMISCNSMKSSKPVTESTTTESIGINVDVHRAPSSVWSIAAADLTGDESIEYILGTVDDQIMVQSADDITLWSAQVKGLPSAIQSGDLNGDGSLEVVASTYDGNLYAFNSKGKQLWNYSTGEEILGLEISDLNNDGMKEVLIGGNNTPLICLNHIGEEICREHWTQSSDRNLITPQLYGISVIRVGDINGNGNKEIILAQPGIMVFEQDGTLLWEWDQGGFNWTSEVIIEDLTGDGDNEIIVGSRPNNRITVLNGKGEILWQHENLLESPIMPYVSTPMLEVGDFTPTQGKEVLVQTFDSMLYLLDASGRRLMSKRLPFAMTSITSPDRNSNRLVTGTGIRETQFYTLTLNTDTQDQFDKMHTEHPAKSNFDTIRNQVAKLPTLQIENTRNSQPYVLLYKTQEPSRAYRYNIPLIYDVLKKRIDSENLNVVMEFMSMEDGMSQGMGVLQPTLFTSDELIEIAAFCEENQVPFIFQILHYRTPFISLTTIEGMLKAAPNMLLGFAFSETFPSVELYKEPIFEYLEGVLKLNKKYGEKKVIFHVHRNRFFHRFMVDPDYFRLLAIDYPNMFIPMLKPNNAPQTDMGIAGTTGLWRSDIITDWGFSSQIGNWRWPGIEREHLAPWDVLMRQELVAASLGAKYFRIERPEMYLNVQRDKNNDNRVTDISVHEDQVKERDLFYTLLNKGIIQQADPKEHKSFSNVVFHEHFELDNSEDSHEKGGLYLERYGLRTVLPAYPPGYIYGSFGEPNRYTRGLMRDNPLGVMSIFPEGVSIDQTPGVKLAWKTDGINVEYDGKIVSSLKAREPILKSFELESKTLPFQSKNIWLSAVQWDKDQYILYVIDPGYFEAWGSDEYVQVDLPWNGFTVTDRITGENLEVHNQRFKVSIPAGAFRILEVNRSK